MASDDVCWYHGNLSREDTDDLLRNGVPPRNGRFLVRDSSSTAKDFVLSVYNEGVIIHYQIRRHGEDAFFSIEENTIVHGLETLIEYYQENANGLICALEEPIRKDAPPHDTRRHGRTNLLHRATKEGNFTVVSELLKCGYRSLEAKNQDGQTAVHLASKQGEEAILEKLIASGANVNCRDQHGNTPLHYACQNNLLSIVRILINNGGANVQIRNTNTGWVSLHEAASRGHKEIVEFLLSVGAPNRPRTLKDELPHVLAEGNGYFQCAHLLKTYESPRSKTKTSRSEWYHGTLSRDEASQLLQIRGNIDGTFLIRYSEHRGYVLTMMCSNKPYNFPITQHGPYYAIDDGPYLDSLEHIVEHYSMMPDGLPTTLQSPIKPRPKPPLPSFHPVINNFTLPSRHRKGYRWSEGNATLPLPPKLQTPRRSIDLDMNSSNHSMGNSNLSLCSSITSIPLPLPDPNTASVFIPQENLILKDVLGEGAFGSVYKALYQTKDGIEMEVAVKTFHKEHINSNERDFIQEAKLMMGLNHHCIVKLIGLSRGETLLMVQELVPLGSLLSFLQFHPEQVSPHYEILLWASQIACGMEYLECQRFVHRDLAARNILLATRHQAKISDFGLSRELKNTQEYYRATQGGRWPIKWYAPESFNYGTFSTASDVWSFGVTLWEMYSYGMQPFSTMRGVEAIELIEKGERLPKPDDCSPEIYQVMEKCWAYHARNRPTFSELVDFFASLNPYENVRELISKTDIS